MSTDPSQLTAVPGSTDPVSATAEAVARELGVDPSTGLSADEVRSRLASYGANRLAAGKKEPAWRGFVRQYEDFMQVILLAAALVNQLVTGDTGTTANCPIRMPAKSQMLKTAQTGTRFFATRRQS